MENKEVKTIDVLGDISLLIRSSKQVILSIDATPDDGYPIRILKAYLEEAEGTYVESDPPQLGEIMNKAQNDRAVILRKAINKLMAGTKETVGLAQTVQDGPPEETSVFVTTTTAKEGDDYLVIQATPFDEASDIHVFSTLEEPPV